MMRLFRTHPFGNEAEAFSNPENVRVDRKGLSPQTEKKQTVNGLRPHPFEASEALLDRLGIHLSNTDKAEPSEMGFDPSEDLPDAPCLLFGQSARTDRAN